MRFFNKTILWLAMVSVAILAVMLGATADGEGEKQVGVIQAPVDAIAHQSTMIAPAPATPAAVEPEVTQEDPPSGDEIYDNWKNWCEPLEYEKQCKEDKDCAGIQHAAQRPLRCVAPHWREKGSDLKLCAPGFSGRVERRWRYARLRELIGQQYFDEPEHCSDWSWEVIRNDEGKARKFKREWESGKPVHKQNWRCGGQWRRAEELTKFLWLIYKRETSARPWKRHRLNPDRAANERAYVKHAKRYGWVVETKCIGKKKRCRSHDRYITGSYPDPEAERQNPHYGNRYRWAFGNGGLGQNTALWAASWDPMAPPEILCLEPVQFETYLRNARDIVKKLDGGIDCDGDLKKDYWNKGPTWAVVHRGASGGKVCPPKNTAKTAEYRKKFEKRAKNLGLDTEKVVTLEMLGKPIPKEGQNVRLEELLTILDEKLPAPF